MYVVREQKKNLSYGILIRCVSVYEVRVIVRTNEYDKKTDSD